MDDKSLRRRKGGDDKDAEIKNSTASTPVPGKYVKLSIYAKFLFAIFGVLSFVLFWGYWFSPVKAVGLQGITEVPKLSGNFAVNNELTQGIKINLPGPECIAEDVNGNLYTGLHDGRIVRIIPSLDGKLGEGAVETIFNGVIPGAEKTLEYPHGRPLGIRVKRNLLYVMDAVYGLYTVDCATGVVDLVISPSVVFPSMKFPDDLVLTSDGKHIYFTDLSSERTLGDMAYGVLDGHCVGRVLRYTFTTKKVEVVISGLCFANGIQLTQDEKTLIVAETLGFRINWFDTTTWKRVYYAPVPFAIDNIRANSRGTYWTVGSYSPTTFGKLLLSSPMLCQALGGLLSEYWLTKIVLEKVLDHHHCIVAEITGNGKIIRTLHDPQGDLIVGCTHAMELSDGRMILGSFFSPALAITNNKMY